MTLGFGKYTYIKVKVPIYERYEEVDEPVYCEECGNGTGSYKRTVGVNKIGEKVVRQRYYASQKIMDRLLIKQIEDTFSRPSLLAFTKGSRINIPKISKQ